MNYKDLKNEYLEYSLNFTEVEKKYINDFADWFPENIIDCHAHCNLFNHLKKVPKKSLNNMISTFFYYSIEDSMDINKIFYPKSNVYTLRFPNVFRGIDHKLANEYLLKSNPKKDGVALFGLPEDTEYTISMLKKYRPNALKMYYFYPKKTAETIYQTFPEEVLSVAEKLNIPAIIHLPKIITESKDDLLEVSMKYPELKICVPHLGSTKFLISGLEDAYKELSLKPNIFLDTSLNPSSEVMRLAFKYFGPDRIMFGSDQPLNLLRAAPYINPNKGQRLITEYNYHWVNNEEHLKFKHLATNLSHSHWKSLTSLRKVIECYPTHEQDKIKNKIFYKNAKDFYKFPKI